MKVFAQHSRAHARPVVSFLEPTASATGGAQQHFKAECDINTIVEKYKKKGVVTHVSRFGPRYGMCSPVDLHNALNVVLEAQQMFDELPARVREKFEGDPEKFLAFVQDEENADEMVELGLAHVPGSFAEAEAVMQQNREAVREAHRDQLGAAQVDDDPAGDRPGEGRTEDSS